MTQYVEYRYTVQEHSHPGLAEKLLQMFESGRQLRICELGCGSGWICHQLAARGHEVLGIDRSESGIETCIESAGPSEKFVNENIDADLPGRLNVKEYFDVVLSNDVIEHLYRPSDLVSAASSLLIPNGKLIIATPYHGYLKNLVIALLGKSDQHFDPLWDGGHIKFFSPRTMKILLGAGGFQCDGFDYWGRLPGIWKSMIVIASKVR